MQDSFKLHFYILKYGIYPYFECTQTLRISEFKNSCQILRRQQARLCVNVMYTKMSPHFSLITYDTNTKKSDGT